MKAWVIKSTDGLYWDDVCGDWDKLYHATLYKLKRDAEETSSNCDDWWNEGYGGKPVRVKIEDAK
jgi:hypothetical protein